MARRQETPQCLPIQWKENKNEKLEKRQYNRRLQTNVSAMQKEEEDTSY
jgi:hypothetical protein